MKTKHMSICRILALLFLELYQMIGRMRNSTPADALYFKPVKRLRVGKLTPLKYEIAISKICLYYRLKNKNVQ